MSTQSQFTLYWPDNSILFEGTNLMSIFDGNNLKSLLGPLLHDNGLWRVSLKLIHILGVHQIRISPHLKTKSKLNYNQKSPFLIYHQLITSGNLFQ